MNDLEINVAQLKHKLDLGEPVVLIDVREDYERKICVIEGDIHIKLLDLEDRMKELDKDSEIVLYCRTGDRSMHATMFLTGNGFKNVKNLKDGIHAWSDHIDPSFRKY